MKKVLMSGKTNYGTVGEATPLVTNTGLKLYVGDVVEKLNDGSSYGETFVVKDNNGYFVMGIQGCCDNHTGEIDSDWDINLIKRHREIGVGEVHDFIKVESELNNIIREEKVMIKEFKVGDRVRIVKWDSVSDVKVGDTAEIIKIESDSRVWRFKIRMDKDQELWHAKEVHLELIPNSQKFEIITEGTTTTVRMQDGRTGVAKLYYKDTYNKGFGIVQAMSKALDIDLVEEVQRVTGSYLIGVDLPTTLQSGAARVVEAIKNIESEGTPKFKVGDKVKIPTTKQGESLEENFSSCIKRADKIGQDHMFLIRIDNEKTFVLNLNKYDTSGDWFNVGDLEAYEEPSYKNPILKEEVKTEPVVFKIGDRVRVRKDLIVGNAYDGHCVFQSEVSRYLGKEAIISGLRSTTDRYNINIDNGRNSWSPSMLEKIEKEAPLRKFKNGDKVKLISNSMRANLEIGDIAVIVDVRDQSMIRLEKDGNSSARNVHPEDIEIVVEPKEIVTEEVAEKFKVGDIIYYKGCKGDIGICKISKIEDGYKLYGKFIVEYVQTLPTTIKEFEAMDVCFCETYISSKSYSVKKLILIDDTEPEYKIGDVVSKEKGIKIIQAGGVIDSEGTKYYEKNGILTFTSGSYTTRSSGYSDPNFNRTLKIVSFDGKLEPKVKEEPISEKSYEVGQELTTAAETEAFIKTGGKIKDSDGWKYYEKNGVLKYKSDLGEKGVSSGYYCINLPVTIFKLPKTDIK